MTVDEAIVRFKNAVAMDLYFERRTAVECQNQRNIWDINCKLGKARIERRDGGIPRITIWNVISKNNQKTKSKNGHYIFDISTETYNELESLYKGDYKFSEVRFKRINNSFR